MRGELARERRVVLRLARVEARVLEHGDALVREELPQPRRDRRDRERRIGPLSAAPGASTRSPPSRRRSSSSSSVGSDARMRVSSATRPSSSGTFRSARTSTRCPATSASRTERGPTCLRTADREEATTFGQVDEPARVAPLVVVPAEDLHHRSVRHRQLAVEDARVRRVHDVGRDERIVRVARGCRRAGRVGAARKASLTSSTVTSRRELHDEVRDRARSEPARARRCRRPSP